MWRKVEEAPEDVEVIVKHPSLGIRPGKLVTTFTGRYIWMVDRFPVDSENLPTHFMYYEDLELITSEV